MNRKSRFRMAAVVTLCCLLAACGPSSPSPPPVSPASEAPLSSEASSALPEASSPSSEASSALPESSGPSFDSCYGPPDALKYALSGIPPKHTPVLTLNVAEEPPGYEKQPAPDFLTKEQQDVYKKAERLASVLLVYSSNICNFPYAEGQDKVEVGPFESKAEIGIFRYYEVTGRYRRWDDLYAVMTSIFQEDYYNVRWRDRFLPGDDGVALYMDGARGTNREWKYDTYELVSQDDGTVAFNVLGHCQKDDGATYIIPAFVEMKQTDDGWRITRFDITY